MERREYPKPIDPLLTIFDPMKGRMLTPFIARKPKAQIGMEMEAFHKTNGSGKDKVSIYKGKVVKFRGNEYIYPNHFGLTVS